MPVINDHPDREKCEHGHLMHAHGKPDEIKNKQQVFFTARFIGTFMPDHAEPDNGADEKEARRKDDKFVRVEPDAITPGESQRSYERASVMSQSRPTLSAGSRATSG